MIDLYPLARPLLFALAPETAHRLTIRMLALGLVPGARVAAGPALETTVAGLRFPNPFGLAAGFDKNAEVPDAMLRQGFGFVEVGTVTPRPQPGNPKPRLFRLVEDRAIINRMGFNNAGLEVVKRRLVKRRRGHTQGLVGANVGANKDSPDPARDYVTGIESLAGLADFFVVNISSPNTPGLRALQGRAALDDLLGRLDAVKPSAKPLFVKIAPDLNPAERRDISEVVLAHGVDGLIVSNTTIGGRDTLKSRWRDETGGLSGQPLFQRATEVLADMYRLTEGRLPLIGAGGVASGRDAYAKIRAGASLIELYTALIYHGPRLIGRMARELASYLERDGFTSVGEAVGVDHRAVLGLK